MSSMYMITLVPPNELAQMSTPPKQNYTVDADAILAELQELWGDIQITSYSEEKEWKYKGEQGTISGTIKTNNISTMSLASTTYMCEVANVYRSIIPPEYTIYIFYLGQPDPIVIPGGTKVEETHFTVK